MPSFLFASNSVGKGIRARLTQDNDGVYVMEGVGVSSSDSYAIYGEDNFQSINVEGTVTGGTFGIHIQAGIAKDNHDSRITIEESGSVYGYKFNGILVRSYANSIENHGTIYGKSAGIDTGSSPKITSTFSTVLNDGQITGLVAGIRHGGSEQLRLTNSGKIEVLTSTLKGSSSYEADGAGRDIITNSGEMIGNVVLGAGTDLYDGRKGHVAGDVLGQDGNDSIYGGTEDNRISGGRGNDALSGGGGADSFVFSDALIKTNIDTIDDFKHGKDTIELFDFVFRSLGNQASGTSALADIRFKDLGVAGAKLDGDDRIIYNRKTGDLSYDDDGAGGKAAVQFAHLNNKAVLTAADFDIFSIGIVG